MARKRMISPSIWESDSFSALSDFSKLVFISLFSHADDEGRGKAKASYIRSITFPNDENRRDADIKKALSEIALHMSVQFYTIDGIEYYVMTNWNEYQTINKPTKSKFPPPQIVGEGGDIHSGGKLPYDYGSTTVGLPHDYGTKKEIEDKENINNTHSAGAREEETTAFEAQFKAFCTKWNVTIDDYSPLIVELDLEKLSKAYSESTKFLQVAPVARVISWVIKNAVSICAGKYKDRARNVSSKAESNRQTSDMLKGIFEHYKTEEEGNGAD